MSAPEWMSTAIRSLEEADHSWFSAFAPPEGHARQSAVLMLFGELEGEEITVLTERSASLRSHPGQVSFPGGGIEAGDNGAIGAALRETQEEVGIDPSEVEIVAALPPLFLRPSSNAVTPVLGYWRAPRALTAVDEREVARVDLIPVADLLNPAHRVTAVHPRRPGLATPAFEVGGQLVWGFTAMLLSTLFDLAHRTLPWDASREVEVPAHLLTGRRP